MNSQGCTRETEVDIPITLGTLVTSSAVELSPRWVSNSTQNGLVSGKVVLFITRPLPTFIHWNSFDLLLIDILMNKCVLRSVIEDIWAF